MITLLYTEQRLFTFFALDGHVLFTLKGLHFNVSSIHKVSCLHSTCTSYAHFLLTILLGIVSQVHLIVCVFLGLPATAAGLKSQVVVILSAAFLREGKLINIFAFHLCESHKPTSTIVIQPANSRISTPARGQTKLTEDSPISRDKLSACRSYPATS